MSHCGAVAGYGREPSHRSDCATKTAVKDTALYARSRPWTHDIRFIRMMEDIERNGPEAIEKYPCALRIALEFGDSLRMLAYLVKTGNEQLTADMYHTIEAQLTRRIEIYTQIDIMRAADDARRDERQYWEERSEGHEL